MFFEHLLCGGTFISFFSPRQPRGGVLLPFSTDEPLRSRELVLRVPTPSGGAGISNSTQSDFTSKLLSSWPWLAWWPVAPQSEGPKVPRDSCGIDLMLLIGKWGSQGW